MFSLPYPLRSDSLGERVTIASSSPASTLAHLSCCHTLLYIVCWPQGREATYAPAPGQRCTDFGLPSNPSSLRVDANCLPATLQNVHKPDVQRSLSTWNRERVSKEENGVLGSSFQSKNTAQDFNKEVPRQNRLCL